MNRQRLLLAGLGGLLVLSVLYAFLATPRQQKAPDRNVATRVVVKGKGGDKAMVTGERLHLDQLAVETEPFPGAGRDIFHFYVKPAPPQAIRPVTMAAPPVAVEPPPPPPPPSQEQLLREAAAHFTFIGYLEKSGVKTVFLTSAGEIYLVKAGDRFGKSNEMVAREVTPKELVIGSVSGSESVRMMLHENEKLVPSLFSAEQGSGVRSAPTGTSLRPTGAVGMPRRNLLTPRAPVRPAPVVEQNVDENVGQDTQPPDDGVKPEESPAGDSPSGDGNGKTE